ncbi:MAG: carboxypeptidase regulatory-like domain-containing protein [Armatimonadetes bacterium]|nr:carboxypeptidase regulatory-like domain-containing protein [Armatimonadota bacterium]
MRRGMMVTVLMLLGASVRAQPPPEGFTGNCWWPWPDPLGANVGEMTEVQAGGYVHYTVSCADKDRRQWVENGQPQGFPELYVDTSRYVNDPPDKPFIHSSQEGWSVTQIGFDGGSGTYTFEFHGDAPMHVEITRDELDHWWFEDVPAGLPGPPGAPGWEAGSRDDLEDVGPLSKTVRIVANMGWIEGYVTDGQGAPVLALVQAWQGGVMVAETWNDPLEGGVYELHELPPGQFVVRATVPAQWGGGVGETNATVTPGQGTQADITIGVGGGGGGGGEGGGGGGEPPGGGGGEPPGGGGEP